MACVEDVLSKCHLDHFFRLVHRIIDKLDGRRGPQYDDYSEIWNLEEWWQVCDHITDLCKQCGRHDWKKEEILELVTNLPEKYRDTLASVILTRRKDLRQSLLDQTTAISGNYLKDFDWRLKLVLSSDKLATIREPLVCVDFSTESSEGSRCLSLELNKEEMRQLIVSLEAANKAVIQLKT